MNVWRIAATIICLGAVFLGVLIGYATAQSQFPCYSMETLLATARDKGDALEVVSGWKGAALARIHKEKASVRYDLTHPVSTVVLIRERNTGKTLVLLQIGGTACAPLPFDALGWNAVILRVWGRGA